MLAVKAGFARLRRVSNSNGVNSNASDEMNLKLKDESFKLQRSKF